MNKINWTGNPFVDTGLCVMIAYARKQGKKVSSIHDLTPTVIREIVGEGNQLAEANRRMSAYTMVFGSNSPLVHQGTNPKFQLQSHLSKITNAKAGIQELETELKQETKEKKRQQIVRKIEKQKDALKQLEKKSAVKKDRAQQGFDRGLLEYKILLQTLAEDVETGAFSLPHLCECSGFLPATDALKVASQRVRGLAAKHLANEKTGKKSPYEKMSQREDFEIGRDWFPLAGSIGNDAQALPAASRPPFLSALALLAVHFLPLGALTRGRSLICFQSNDVAIQEEPLFQLLTERIFETAYGKWETTSSGKIRTADASDAATQLAEFLLDLFDLLQKRKSLKIENRLPDYVNLTVWQFSNDGRDPRCEITEIPNPALQFLWEANQRHRDDITKYLKSEKEFQSDNRLLDCIQRNGEYFSFYPHTFTNKKTKEKISIPPAGKELFSLYQQRLLNRPVEMLQTAEWLAEKLRQAGSDGQDSKRLQKLMKGLSDSKKRFDIYVKEIKGQLAVMAEIGDLTLEEYSLLMRPQSSPFRIEAEDLGNVLRLIWFYLNHETTGATRPQINGDLNMFTHPKIKTFAKDLFDYFTRQRKYTPEKVKENILDRFKRKKLTQLDVQQWFLSLAETKSGYSNEDWDNLCRDENGANNTFEVMFQLRLELANLYREYASGAVQR